MAAGWITPWAIWQAALSKYIIKQEDGLGPSWEFPNRQGYVPILTNDDVYIKHVDHFNKILAASATVIRAGEDLSPGTPITFTISAQPDVPRNITWAFVAHAQITAYSFTITGKDAKGATITDTFTEADDWSGATSQAYATVTSIIMTARTGTGAGDTMNVGTGSLLGLSNNVDATGEVYKVVKSIAAGNAGDYPAASYTVAVTADTVDVSTGAAIVNGDSYTIYFKSRLYTQV